jgi:hypothetical protein
MVGVRVRRGVDAPQCVGARAAEVHAHLVRVRIRVSVRVHC